MYGLDFQSRHKPSPGFSFQQGSEDKASGMLAFLLPHFILKSLLNCYSVASVLCFWIWGRETCGILAPWGGIKPSPAALEGEVLTAEWLEKSPASNLNAAMPECVPQPF